jgi:eukaryotic-like serine/threonine-protein kinase
LTTLSRSLKELFLAAVEVAPEARTAWLERECGTDADLRERLGLMLAAHDAPQSLFDRPGQVAPIAGFLDPTGVDATLHLPSCETIGAVIGPYKLLQEIGQGGMGIVYMAEQHEPVKRRVALKIIKPGMDTRQVIARFEAERQALSLMDHPNIAKVLDAGTTDSGRPYFVMELVKGQPITQYCDEKHLTPRQRLELLLPVCQAIQHAHQKGIIHRDIKPTNILVAEYDQQPVPKVIDFGVAKAISQSLTEKTMFTGLGQIVGTLEYMSPEQAEVNQLDIDTRSDIYSLGVLLYELLTGSTPFDKQRLRSAAFDEMLRIIREEEPPKPSTRLSHSHDSLPSISAQRHTEPAKLTKLVRGELDWIVMKALEKDRNRRYETANGFAMDVQRYLADEAVLACPPSVGYRFRKFARRNKAALSTAAAIILALVLGFVISAWQAIRATEAENLASTRAAAEKKARDETEVARKEAVANLQKAREAVDQMLTRVAEEKLLDVPQMEPLRKALLEDALKFYEQFLQQRSTDVEIRLETGNARRRVAEIYRHLGQYSEAEKEYHRSITLLKELQAEGPLRIQVQEGLAMAYSRLGFLLISPWLRFEGAEKAYREAIALWQKLAAERPEQTEYRHQLADCLQRLGNVLRGRGQYPPAEHMLRRALSIHESLVAGSPGEHRYQHNVAINHFFLGYLFCEPSIGRWDEAILEHRQALRIQEQLVADAPLRADYRHFLGEVNWALGNAYSAQGNMSEAEPAYRRAIELWNKLRTEFPKVPAYVKYLAFSYDSLGTVLFCDGRTEDSIASYTKAIELKSHDWRAWHHRGWAYSQLGEWDKAVTDYTKVIELRPDFGDAWHGRGFAHAALGQWENAVGDQTKALELTPKQWHTWWRRAQAYSALKQWDQAIADYAKAIELGATESEVWISKAAAHAQLDQPDQAIAELKQAITKGFRNPQQLRNCEDLAALREREDFQKLLTDLEAKNE